MPIPSDLLQAKQVLSARFLRAGLSGGAVAMAHTFSVNAVVASAGRNVHAVGIGRKITDGKVTATLCVRLFVAQKIAPSLLSPRDALPDKIDGISTDIIASAPAFFKASKPKKAAVAAAASCTDSR